MESVLRSVNEHENERNYEEVSESSICFRVQSEFHMYNIGTKFHEHSLFGFVKKGGNRNFECCFFGRYGVHNEPNPKMSRAKDAHPCILSL